MPKTRHSDRSSRQRPVSCHFCRSRKLRCSRETPCSNCASRGILCRVDSPTSSTPAISEESCSDILERLRRLEEVVLNQTKHRGENSLRASASPAQSTSRSDTFQASTTVPNSTHEMRPDISPRLLHFTDDIAWLERVSMGEDFSHLIPPNRMVFKIGPIQHIPKAPSYIHQPAFASSSAELVRCVWLPQYHEAKVLLDKYITDINYIHNVVHVPSLSSIIDDVYARLNGQGQIKPGHVILLLSIFASTTYSWTQQDCERALFSNFADVNSQTPFWINATQDVLDIAQRSTCVSLEHIQGIIIMAFVVVNLEGISQRYRSLMSMALMIGRELLFHRCDLPSNAQISNTIRIEMGRRVWWNLATTDWLLAARYTGPTEGIYMINPHHMVVRKPRHINDEELVDGASCVEQPLSQPTEMSYLLQKIRLAEICRKIIDRTPLTIYNSGSPNYSDVVDVDAELDTFINNIPSFFSVDKDTLIQVTGIDPAKAPGIVVQGYMLNIIINTQRCKLHLPYLARSSVDPTYAYSRSTCLKAARLIIQTELKFQNENLPFVLTRLNNPGILYGVCLASIVLLMDLCLKGPALESVTQRGEVAEAFRILEGASDKSVTAARLLESLKDVLHKHKLAPPNSVQSSSSAASAAGPSLTTTSSYNVTINSPLPTNSMDIERGNSMEGQSGLLNSENSSSYFDELSQSFDARTEFDFFDWTRLFSELNSSFI